MSLSLGVEEESDCCRRWESSAAGVGEVEASWVSVEVVEESLEEREDACAIRDSASFSEMNVSENMTSY